MKVIKGIISLFTFLWSTLCFAQGTNQNYFEGKKYFQQKNYKKAVASFTKAIIEEDNVADYYLERGIAYVQLNDQQNAYDDLSKAIKYDYTRGEAYYHRGKILMINELFNEAINDFDMTIKYPPNDSLLYRGYLLRGESRSCVMNYTGAISDCEKFLEVDSTNRDALNTIALAKNDLKFPEESIKYLNKILTYFPGDTVAIVNMGFVNISLEKWDTAFKYLVMASKLSPKVPHVYSNLSYVKMKKGDLSGAMKDVNYSLNLDPNNSWAFKNRGLIYLEMKENDKACEEFQTALKKGFTDRYGNEVSDLIYENCNKKAKSKAK